MVHRLRFFKDLQTALGWLTRIPVYIKSNPSGTTEFPKLENSFWLFPIIGGGIGFLTAYVMFMLYNYVLIPSYAAVALGLLGAFILTGGLHEDGLADCADGCAAGSDMALRLKIMRDSQLGTYGVLSLILVMIIKISLIEYVLVNRPQAFFAILILSALLSRAIIPFALKLFPAKDPSSSAFITYIHPLQLIFISTISVFALFYLFNPHISLYVVLTLIIVLIAIGFWAKWRLNGMTGDVCGALAVLCEIGVLLTLISLI